MSSKKKQGAASGAIPQPKNTTPDLEKIEEGESYISGAPIKTVPPQEETTEESELNPKTEAEKQAEANKPKKGSDPSFPWNNEYLKNNPSLTRNVGWRLPEKMVSMVKYYFKHTPEAGIKQGDLFTQAMKVELKKVFKKELGIVLTDDDF